MQSYKSPLRSFGRLRSIAQAVTPKPGNVPQMRTGIMLRAMENSLEQLAERRRTSLATLREQTATSERRATGNGENPISLFILGPSRSGKSTMERLVGGLAGVKRGYEIPLSKTPYVGPFNCLPFRRTPCSVISPRQPIRSVAKSTSGKSDAAPARQRFSPIQIQVVSSRPHSLPRCWSGRASFS